MYNIIILFVLGIVMSGENPKGWHYLLFDGKIEVWYDRKYAVELSPAEKTKGSYYGRWSCYLPSNEKNYNAVFLPEHLYPGGAEDAHYRLSSTIARIIHNFDTTKKNNSNCPCCEYFKLIEEIKDCIDDKECVKLEALIRLYSMVNNEQLKQCAIKGNHGSFPLILFRLSQKFLVPKSKIRAEGSRLSRTPKRPSSELEFDMSQPQKRNKSEDNKSEDNLDKAKIEYLIKGYGPNHEKKMLQIDMKCFLGHHCTVSELDFLILCLEIKRLEDEKAGKDTKSLEIKMLRIDEQKQKLLQLKSDV